MACCCCAGAAVTAQHSGAYCPAHLPSVISWPPVLVDAVLQLHCSQPPCAVVHLLVANHSLQFTPTTVLSTAAVLIHEAAQHQPTSTCVHGVYRTARQEQKPTLPFRDASIVSACFWTVVSELSAVCSSCSSCGISFSLSAGCPACCCCIAAMWLAGSLQTGSAQLSYL
jgi:hypothetical protein